MVLKSTDLAHENTGETKKDILDVLIGEHIFEYLSTVESSQPKVHVRRLRGLSEEERLLGSGISFCNINLMDYGDDQEVFCASRANTISIYPTQSQCMNELVDDHDMSVCPGFLRSGFIIDEPRTFMWSSDILLKLGDLLNKKYSDGTWMPWGVSTLGGWPSGSLVLVLGHGMCVCA